ncbi:MAG: flavodoxin family protein [Deltaproteobacteria bacterium]|nr:flavodoxin family protein [Deltaproteobacteria bacterium]
MYAIAINGSPRKGGNTELLLKEVLGELDKANWETELVKVGGTAIRGCIACNKCFEKRNNKCVNDADTFNEIFSKMLKAVQRQL